MCFILRAIREEDCDLLFEWINDTEVRQAAFNSDTILYEDHRKWFYNKLGSSLTHMFIICVRENPVGQIRIDMGNNEGVLDYSIAKKYRGYSYGSRALEKIIVEVKERGIKINRLIGRVKIPNIQSRKAFENAGFRGVDKQDYIEYYKMI